MTRKDNDYTVVPDTGCPDLGIASCFNCPLPRCRYEEGAGGARAAGLRQRDTAIVLRHKRGESIHALAERYEVSISTIKQVLADDRKVPVLKAQPIPYSEAEFRRRYDRGETVSVRTEPDGSRVIVVDS